MDRTEHDTEARQEDPSERVGIEYAHIYTDQKFKKQHMLGIAELHRLSEPPNSTRVILIDDYSTEISANQFDLTQFLHFLTLNDAIPDAIILESAFVNLCPRVIDLISERSLRRKVSSYHRSRGRYPCSLLIATWYLLRLGAFGHADIHCVHGDPSKLYADRLVTILPDCFVTPEAEALKIIRSTRFRPMADKVEHLYFEHQEDGYSHWEEFDALEYVTRNYGQGIAAEDREIVEFLATALRSTDFAPERKSRVADVGAGPNLYPALLLSPYLADNGILELIDIATPNLEYLQSMKDGVDEEQLAIWKEFEAFINELGVGADLSKVQRLSIVKKGSIFELEPERYDAVLSFFVGDSITDNEEKFDMAIASLMASVKPSGHFIVTHMMGSHGYFAGERTYFPGVALSIDQIVPKYNAYGRCTYHTVRRTENGKSRRGYEGMTVIIGKKLPK